jgi:YD repeat-containing protein
VCRTWDAENRLIAVTSNGQTTQFVYDGDGARVLQVKPDGTTTAYPSASLRAGFGGLMEVTLPTADVIFADGFESGNFSAWSAEVDAENDLNVTTGSALVGAQGMAALIDNTTAMYVRDDSPNNETRYRARFYFDPNTLTMADGNTHDLFVGRGGGSDVLHVQFRKSGGAYQVNVGLLLAGDDQRRSKQWLDDAVDRRRAEDHTLRQRQ